MDPVQKFTPGKQPKSKVQSFLVSLVFPSVHSLWLTSGVYPSVKDSSHKPQAINRRLLMISCLTHPRMWAAGKRLMPQSDEMVFPRKVLSQIGE